MGEEEHSHFNLVDEPWIVVRDASGRPEELSLFDVFEKASTLDFLANETPQQDFAILRVLLAIIQRSLNDDVGKYIDDNLYPSDVWGEMWKSRKLPVEKIRAYLDKWRYRFDLFDDEVPFMQAAGLEASSGKVADARKLLIIAEKPSLNQMRTGHHLATLNYSEAARWLVTVQAFDISGIKTAAEGDPNTSQGKGHAKGPGWDGQIGCVYATGATLAETLLLNTVLCEDGQEFDEWFSSDDLPCWEMKPQLWFMADKFPRGRMNLYTWQSRRICLSASNGRVTGVTLTVGDKFDYANKNNMEWFTAWIRNANEERRLGISPVYLPVRHQANRAMWRGLESILPTTSIDSTDVYLAPGILRWLGFLASQNGGEQIESAELIHLCAVGFEYGTRDSVILESINDGLEISVFLLSPRGALASESAKHVVRATEDAIAAFGKFAASLVLASGFTPDKKRESKRDATSRAKNAAEAEAYFYFDGKYRAWLASLDQQSDLAEREGEWADLAMRAFRGRLVSNLLSQFGPPAIVGHPQKTGWESAAHAQIVFFGQLGKCLGPLLGEEQEEACTR